MVQSASGNRGAWAERNFAFLSARAATQLSFLAMMETACHGVLRCATADGTFTGSGRLFFEFPKELLPNFMRLIPRTWV